MKRKIFINMCVIAVISIVCTAFMSTFIYYYDFDNLMREQIQTEAVYLEAAINSSGDNYLNSLNKSELRNRLTLIDADGKVLYDSVADISKMENHAQRPEIKAAMETGEGHAMRMSATLSEKTYYYAVKLDDRKVLRVSSTTDSIFKDIAGLLPWMILITIAIMLLSIYVAKFLARRLVAPINSIDLDNLRKNDIYDEFAPLLIRIDRQKEIIRKQEEDLRQRRQEFTAITENMSEGIIVINSSMKILSYNNSVLNILGLSKVIENSSILTLNRSTNFRKGVELVLEGMHNEQTLLIDEHNYLLISNPVYNDDKLVGAAIIILDITEKEEREKLRREFSANVSHELKTPLTAISGTAEIIRNGIAKQEDIPHFADNIYNEAQRLISMVNDIIKLSQLDENTIPFDKEPLDIYSIAENVIERLKDQATEKKVSMNLSGKHAIINGAPAVLDEMIYNLCENAIKYNIENGSVTVSVGRDNEDHVVLSVSDTGIGISKAHQDRVFERFYRVEKSRSKNIEGTGLGLSIVKHGAAFHDATVEIKSELGKGTEITLRFY